jgi:hypothetical protein
MARQYTPARAFRAALEQRLNTLAHNEGLDLTRLRRRVAFERLLARFFAGHPAAPVWVLKGGYGLEVRLRDHACSTLDIDLGIPAPAQIAPPGPDQADLIWEPYSRRLRSIWMTGLPSRLGPPCTIWRHLPTEESVTQWRPLLIIVFLRGSIWRHHLITSSTGLGSRRWQNNQPQAKCPCQTRAQLDRVGQPRLTETLTRRPPHVGGRGAVG